MSMFRRKHPGKAILRIVFTGANSTAPILGLGDLGIRYGYQRFMPDAMAAVVAVLIALVQGSRAQPRGLGGVEPERRPHLPDRPGAAAADRRAATR